ncbi:MAG: putative nucleotidyltransferase [Lentisphaeria bacterium]|jgi:predicted nucleotidyltransferase
MKKAFIEKLQTVLQLAPVKIDAAYVFGSVAQGTARADSDIDIAVACQPLDSQQKMQLWDALAEAVERPVDLVELSKAGTTVYSEALSGERIVGDAQTHACLLARMLVDEADFGPIYKRMLKERREAWIGE